MQGMSRNEAERWRLESEYKAELDMQSRLGGAKREDRRGGEERVLDLLEKGYTLESIKRELSGRGIQA